MTTHLTVRMAWHDNNWNGTICSEPDKNHYCTGCHSLLSSRLKKNKNTELEVKNVGKKLDSIDGYLPPCYWTSNAFSPHSQRVNHKYPIPGYEKDAGTLTEELLPYSVFTWPFKLSFNKGKTQQTREGSYPPDLRERIGRFLDRFEKKKSIIFFYLNYDNPVLDEGENSKYVLLGCSLLSDSWKKSLPENYGFSDERLSKIRTPNVINGKKSIKMKNFPKMAWNLQFSHDFENSGVLLPYKEYLTYRQQYDDGEEKLKEMRALIEEESLISSFKYVAMDIDDDKCIYLLNKLRKSFSIVQSHKIPSLRDHSRELSIIEKLLQMTWGSRGLYPGFPAILDILANKDRDDLDKHATGRELSELIKKKYPDNPIEGLQHVLAASPIPDPFKKHKIDILEIKKQIKAYDIALLKRLSLFNLTQRQLERILDDPQAFLNPAITKSSIVNNPYLLCESYLSKDEDKDADAEQVVDESIDLFKIDIGMFPQLFLEDRSELQDLTLKSPERLRALAKEHLHRVSESGHCYSTLDAVYKYIVAYPLFFGDAKIAFDKNYLFSKGKGCFSHFSPIIEITQNDNGVFFYLKEVYEAERYVQNFTAALLKRPDYEWDTSAYKDYVIKEKSAVKKAVLSLSEEDFIRERTELLTTIFKKSIFVLSGQAGSGKTYALKKIVEELHKRKENVLLLAPTGKAALRLKTSTGAETYTMDRFIYLNKEGAYWEYLDNFENFSLKTGKVKHPVENVIIDEASMIDLEKLATLLSMFSTDGKNRITRLIFVGDEYQLPPIGLGKPFADLISYLQTLKSRGHYIRLSSNCRNGFDENITSFADIFADNPYYEEILAKAQVGGPLSDGLHIVPWETDNELNSALLKRIYELTKCSATASVKDKSAALSRFFGLRDNGTIEHENFDKTLRLDHFQVITPYHADFYGTLSLNDLIQKTFREPKICRKQNCIFFHADKIICTLNWYRGYGKERRLELSNGSIGVAKNDAGDYSRTYYFPDEKDEEHGRRGFYQYLNEEENFELGYAITVHKSQGSDFEHTFVVIPRRQSLLSRELVYTALTRSRKTVTIFLQKSASNLLERARGRSQISTVASSLFSKAGESERRLCPEPGVLVRSYQEYCIYRKLKGANIPFAYEKELVLPAIPVPIHPDFTILDQHGKPALYWEHLGMLNTRKYAEPWQVRQKAFEKAGYANMLVTTDALGGFEDEILDKLIEDIKKNKLRTTERSFSRHHYQLYR